MTEVIEVVLRRPFTLFPRAGIIILIACGNTMYTINWKVFNPRALPAYVCPLETPRIPPLITSAR